jgi:hypothetical protein
VRATRRILTWLGGILAAVAVVPAWIEVPPEQIRDAHHIAHALASEALEFRPIAATLDWVTGVTRTAPVSGRAGDDRSQPVVRGEMMLSDAVAMGQPELDEAWWRSLGVAPARPITSDVVWARGVSSTAAWLLQVQTRPPVRLPRRLADGSTPTAEQLYAEAAAGGRLIEPEQRQAAWTAAERDAHLYRRLAALAASPTA